MILSFWRLSHLFLAIFSAVFLIVASITGVILAFEPISKSLKPYAFSDLKNIELRQTILALENEYDTILEFEVTPSLFIKASVITNEGTNETIYIHPKTGKKIGAVEEKPLLFHWTTNLHRSLFLKSTGRVFIGIISFLLSVIAITGLLLVIKRQGGFFKLFSRIKEENFEQRYHVIFGRWLLIPIIIIALSGVYLSAEKFSLLPERTILHNWNATPSKALEKKPLSEFPVFKNTTLNELKKITFPFSDATEDYYHLEISNRGELLLHQYTGEIISEIPFSFVQLASQLSLKLHTGQGSVLWSLILLIASISILFFIYSGFTMTIKRRKKSKKVILKLNKDDCEFIILVGSEMGNAYEFATLFYKALVEAHKNVFLTTMNDYSTYKTAKHVIIFTSTYGDGEPPTNARHFSTLFNTIEPTNKLLFSVIGFGSLLYPNYCRFAITVDALLHNNNKYKPVLPLVKINEQSEIDLKNWVRQWSDSLNISLNLKWPGTQNESVKQHPFKVIERSDLNTDNTFLLKLKPKINLKFESGDLIGITPKNDQHERHYSIAKVGSTVLLSVKKHENGLCSSYLNNLEIGEEINSNIIKNTKFHFPNAASTVILISNGTGIAPFLGMIEENKKHIPIYLFWGGRTKESFKLYEKRIKKALSEKRLKKYQNAYSQDDGKKQYVQHLLLQQSPFIAQVLKQGGVIMICGSLLMQQDVLETIETITTNQLKRPLSDFESNEQLAMDCY